MDNLVKENDARSRIAVIMTLAWPVILEQFMQTAAQFVDTFMVSSLGRYATAAVGSTTTVNWLIGGSVAALGIGFLAFIAQSYGAERYEEAAKASSQSAIVALIIGAVLTLCIVTFGKYVPVWMQVEGSIQDYASSYFVILNLTILPRSASIIFASVIRASGDTKTPMRISVGINILNLILNFFLIYDSRTVIIFGCETFIYGAGLGIDGAAIASALSYGIAGVLMTIALWRHPVLSPKRYGLHIESVILKRCLKIAVPNMLQRFTTSFGYVVFAATINSTGDISTAACTITNTLESLAYLPGYGMQAAAATLSGNCVGAKDRGRMESLGRIEIIIIAIMMSLTGAFLYFCGPAIATLFSNDEAVLELCGTALRMVAVTEPFFGMALVTEGILQGAGQTFMPFVLDSSCMWGVRIVGTLICIKLLGMGFLAAWACMIAHNMTLLVLLRSYYRFGKWRSKVFE